ncbi:MAG: 30S ribosomal protein S9 [bacterium]
MEGITQIHTSGSRKTAVARAFLKPGSGAIVVNTKLLSAYFHRQALIDAVMQPLIITNTTGSYDLRITVKGGGTTGQAGAIRHAIARALLRANREEFHDPLKKADLLTRDQRVKERKKYGLKRARKAPTYRKR